MFDPKTREITMVFQEIGKSLVGKRPLWRRAGFNLVSDAGDPDRWIEPVSANLSVDTLGTAHTVFSTPATAERIVGIEYSRGRMFEVHNFSPDYFDPT